MLLLWWKGVADATSAYEEVAPVVHLERKELKDTLKLMEDVEGAVRELVARVYEPVRENAEFQAIVEASDFEGAPAHLRS